ncbi:MAG TPA: App1 family protein [Thermoanaerobaculia bacterium]
MTRQVSPRAWGLFLLLGLFVSPATAFSQIRMDERVVFFPTAARQSDDGQHWIATIHGWIHEPKEDNPLHDGAVRSLVQQIGGNPDLEEARILAERCRQFLADNERGKDIRIRIAGKEHSLPPSDEGGHFSGEIRMASSDVARFATGNRLVPQALTGRGDRRVFAGSVVLIPREGISVISDIDDTIKISEVRDHHKLMQNTFLREFQAVPGMSEAYRRWSAAGAEFHFVSSSPWQLYEALDEFAREAGFPPATYHLKRFRLKDSSFLKLFADPLTTKPPLIESLLAAYPQRRFVLVGDSGEHDPEVYGLIARRFPAQVAKVYIRDVTDEPATSERYRQAFAHVPTDVWQIFTDPSVLELP